VEGQYFVLQPGSSVATSLSGGESVEKKVVIMEIKQDQYRTVPVPLHTTRPFIMADVKLADEIDALDATPQIIEEFLTDKVMQLIANAKRQFRGTAQLLRQLFACELSAHVCMCRRMRVCQVILAT
jgi:double-strand break repair protein MRE11